MTVERVELYRHVPLPGQNIPVGVTPFTVEDSIRNYEEISWAVCILHLNRSGGLSGMCAQHLCQWISESTR